MPGKARVLYLTDRAVTPLEVIPNCGILCENTRILAIGGQSAFSLDEPGLTVVDMSGTTAYPGLIDSHIHGTGGVEVASFCRKDPEAFSRLGRTLAAHGVTTYFPTLVTGPREEMLAALENITDMMETEYDGARVMGINLEGPFINPVKAGAQRKEYTSEVDLGFARELLEAGKGRIKLMTFAPELKDSDKLIVLLMENGVIPSMGHSLAGEAETYRAMQRGVTRCTHLLNGMPPLHQRQSDLTLIALTDERLTVELINDGGHLHPLMVKLACKAKPAERIIGVSNAVDPVASLPFNTGGLSSHTDKGAAETDGGLILGSVTLADQGLKKLIADSRLDERFAARCYTLNPAKDLGLIMRGELVPGKNADIAFFDTEAGEAVMTVIRGKIVYNARKPK